MTAENHTTGMTNGHLPIEADDTSGTAERALDAKTRELDARERRLNAARQDLERDQRVFEERSAQLAKEHRSLAELERKAQAGFAAQNRAALAELEKTHAALLDETTKLQNELAQTRLAARASLQDELKREREVLAGAFEEELENARRQHRRTLDAERVAHDAALAAERERIAQARAASTEEADQLRASINEREASLHRARAELRYQEEDFAGRCAAAKRVAEESVREQVAALEQQLNTLRDDYRYSRANQAALERRIDDYAHLMERVDNPAELNRRLDESGLKIAELEQELLERPSASDKERLAQALENERVLEKERKRLEAEVRELKAEQSRWFRGVADLEQQRDLREVAERRREVLLSELDKYKIDVERLRVLHERPEERAARIGTIEKPWLAPIVRASRQAAPTELTWLAGIAEKCAQSGMHFPERLLQTFHTSLKVAELSPLTVLAGVSGTGKSELPRLYARFGGLAFLPLAVQPNWDSPQSLFGYFNAIDNRFSATTLLRAMVQAQHKPDDPSYKDGMADRLLLVLLDEMNLAYVEQYFSDLLSRLEQRRGETRDVSLEIDLGAGVAPYELKLRRNVLWVGTMNEDETTRSLSDKVVDRANLLHFPRPRTLQSRPKVTLAEESPLLAQETWRSWLKDGSSFLADETRPFREALEAINESLQEVSRALGHRVWQSVEFYMANHPAVINARENNDRDALQRALRIAYEDQLVLKVMPKLRGIETSGEAKRRCLDPIRTLLERRELGLGLTEDFELACRVGQGAFIWGSAKYLENGR
ncbi:hypothetical protein WM26_16140 [Burkholderia cepacia]|uniref:hypothetical protein n=1 Tax=Burkholderia cepacia TaxID=292 RepID=UPI00075F8619|nr:hypothetical protein [Burkholderia cepacia]KWO11899.1 hypothetical protein WM26_16140 [Burkholderia cepacia]